ncbi:uncharacterized, partial [Tachysurus ichikawai]
SNYRRSRRSTVESANCFNLRRDFRLSKQTSRSRPLLTETLEPKCYVSHERRSGDEFIEDSNALGFVEELIRSEGG